MKIDVENRSFGVDATTLSEDERGSDSNREPSPAVPAILVLVLAWSKDEPWRIGETLLLPQESGSTVWVGRGTNIAGKPIKGNFGQQRPGEWAPSPAFISPSISRYQLSLRGAGDGYVARNEGKCPLLRNGVETAECAIGAGDLLQLGKQFLFLCCRRPARLAGEGEAYPTFPFGHADPHGLVGESPAMWRLRQRILFVAARPEHVMLTGPSGSGKDLVANALHALSSRRSARMVSRNAATLPETLVDAELFGNTRNYPNPGMLERPGLIGEAHRSTLFLDEFAELPQAVQAHLLTVLDRGEYQRLGDASTRVSDFRLIAATNRGLSSLKPDLLARLTFRIAVPDLNARLEDVPLLVRHVMKRLAGRGDPAALDLFPGRDPLGEPRVPLRWIVRLLQRRYQTNGRELEALLWEALLSSESVLEREEGSANGGDSEEPDDVDGKGQRGGGRIEVDAGMPTLPPPPPDGPTSAERIQQSLDANNGSIELTWRALGLSSRFRLMRLIKKYGLEVRRRPV